MPDSGPPHCENRHLHPLRTTRNGLFVSAQTVTDRFAPLPAGAVRLTNFLENDIRNSIEHWNKGELPYREFVEFFRSQAAPQFALGEMWGKAVRSAACFTDTPRARNSKAS